MDVEEEDGTVRSGFWLRLEASFIGIGTLLAIGSFVLQMLQ